MSPDWMDRAACREYDPDAWFPVGVDEERVVVAICHTCPVRVDCLTYAIAHDERYGVWGGMTERQMDAARRTAVLRRPPTCPDCGGPRDPRYKRCPGCQLVFRRRAAVEANRRSRVAS